jgi:ADP-heptose:LPS heptosyltransferase
MPDGHCLAGNAPDLSLPSCKRLLVVINAPIGDMIMSSPAIRLLRKKYPGARMTLRVSSGCADLLNDATVVDRVIPENKPEKKFPRLLWRLRRALACRFARYDACFFLQEDASDVRYLKMFAAIPVRVCASHTPTGVANKAVRYCTHVIPLDPARLHMVEYYRGIVRGGSSPPEEDGLWIAPLPEPAAALEGMRRFRGASPRVIALCCKGSDRSRHNWPQECWGELARRLAADGHSLVAFPPPWHIAYMEEVRRLSGAAIDIRAVTLVECAALMRHADLLVSVDTGQVHIAVALGVPVLSLAGPTMLRTYPYTRKGLAIAASSGCQECPFPSCLTNKKAHSRPLQGYSPPCMLAITPETVWRHCRLLLENPFPPRPYELVASPAGS